MPSASDRTAANAKTGLFLSALTAYRRSIRTASIHPRPRASRNRQGALRDLLDARQDAVSMQWPEGYRLEDEQVERARQELRLSHASLRRLGKRKSFHSL